MVKPTEEKKETRTSFKPTEFESKWQTKWESDKVFTPDLKNSKNPYYNLMMFPYPSAEGLHVGNMYAFTGADVYARFNRMQGKDVFEPIGLDGFGIHSENYALKVGKNPKEQSKVSQANFYRQLKSIGNSFDWNRTLETYDPLYYRWTQWLFIQLFKAGLAYRKKAEVNWCPSCKTVLSDEQVVDTKCERCGTVVEKKDLEQWFFRITDYADRLLQNIDGLDWTEKVKIAQKNWIGKKTGGVITFHIAEKDQRINVFTTRPDTLYGATFLVLAPEHPLVDEILSFVGEQASPEQVDTKKEVSEYIKLSKSKSNIERTDDNKEKTGVFSGLYAINPINNEKLPVWIADYVLSGYGTGAIMAVPAHDQRDHDFAIKYGLPIRKVIDPNNEFQSLVMKKSVDESTFKKEITSKGMYVKDYSDWGILVTGGDYAQDDYLEIVQRSLISDSWYADSDGSLKAVIFKDKIFKLPNESKEAFNYGKEKGIPEKQLDWQSESNYAYCYDGKYGQLINSGPLDGLQIPQALNKLLELHPDWITEKTNFHLRDWLISRQRYWGPPIPMLFCQACADNGKSWFTSKEYQENSENSAGLKVGKSDGQIIRKSESSEFSNMAGWYSVPFVELPVLLPDVADWKPMGTGKSPLANHPEFYETVCPECGSKAARETDVSDTFLDSAWYFLGYISDSITGSKKETISKGIKVEQENFTPWDKNTSKKWLPVKKYIGGAEHSVLHLLYARFISMVLHDLKFTDFEEPFQSFFAHGLIIKDGAKMSKSKGNVVVPDTYIEKYGADTLRAYLMFLGPFSDGGDFRDSGIEGMHRFIRRVWNMASSKVGDVEMSPEGLTIMHKTIKKATEDIEAFKYNTVIATLMEWYNFLSLHKTVHKTEMEVFLKLLAPFAPFMTEELWQDKAFRVQGESFKSIHLESWPEYEEKHLVTESTTIIVQINGKKRGEFILNSSSATSQEMIEATAKKSVEKYLEGSAIKKIIYVPRKIVNFVI